MKNSENNKDQLLAQIACELKLPLNKIYLLAGQTNLDTDGEIINSIKQESKIAMAKLDGYLYGLSIYKSKDNQVPFHLSALINDAAHDLDKLAKDYNVNLEVDLKGKLSPVMVSREGMKHVLYNLGSSFIQSIPAMEIDNFVLRLGAYKRGKDQVVVGAYIRHDQIKKSSLYSSKKILGSAAQPNKSLSYANNSGVFVAEEILKIMDLDLISTARNKMTGLGTILKPTKQLEFNFL